MKKISVILGLLLIVSCGGTSTQGDIKLKPPTHGDIYFSAFPDFGGTEDVVTEKRINDFNTLVGKKMVWASFSDNWYNGIKYPLSRIHAINNTGTIPYVRMMPRSDDVQGHAEQHFTMQKIIDGQFDSDLRKWAHAAKKDNIPLLIDFAVEANGDWFPWSGKFTGGSTKDNYGDSNHPDGPERYRDAYRHVIDLFRDEGVHHVTWFYHFNYAPFPNEAWNQPKNYYPGDDYIDWIGFSLYGAQTIDEEWEGLEFSTQLVEFKASLESLNTNKPVALLEFGVTDGHPEGNKKAWFVDAFETILNNDVVAFDAINPWHENWQNEDETYTRIRLDSSPEVLALFKQEVGKGRFITEPNF